MVQLIVGNKGSGKTKKLIEEAMEKLRVTNGNVVVIEKGKKLHYDISHPARLIDIDEYKVRGFEAFYGFLAGICAGNYDVTDILVDGTLKICGRDFESLEKFILKLKPLTENADTIVTLSISADMSELTESIKDSVTLK